MLKHAEANLSALIESTHDLIWSVDLDYRLITFNRALQQNIQDTVGVRLAEGMLPKDFVPPERAGLLPPLYGRALAEGSFRDEFSLADDNILELTFNPIVVNGKAKGISVFGKDITKRKAAEDALHEAGEKYREIFEGALEGIFQTTLEGRSLAANPALARMLGYDSPEDFISSVKDTAYDVWAFPNERARYIRLLEENGVLRGYECELKRKDGSKIWVKLSARKTYAADGVTPINEGFLEEITEQKKSKSALKEAEANLSALIESTQDLIWSVDLDYRLITFNRALQQNIQDAVGVRLAEGMRFHEVLPPERAVFWLPFYARVLAEGPFRVEYSLINGSILELAFNPIVVDGETTGISIFGKEISERKAAEESRRFLADVVESCEEAIITNAPSGEILTWNHGAETIYGYTAGEAIGKPFSMVIAPERRALADGQLGELLGGAPLLETQGVALRKDGSRVHVTVTTWPIRNSAGEVTAICTIVRDVSVRHEAEKAHALLASVVESSGDLIHAVNLDGTIASWNSGAERLTGYTSEEILGKHVVFLATFGFEEQVRQNLKAIQKGCIVGPFDVVIRRKDGTGIDVSLTLSPIQNSDGEVVGGAAIARDISQRKQIERALQEAEKKYRDIFEGAVEGICQATLEGKFLSANPAVAKMLGYDSPEELISMATDLALDMWVNPDDRALYLRQLEEHGSVRGFECQFKRKDGRHIWVSLNDRMVCGADGRLLYLEGFLIDITERKLSEEALRESLDSLMESQAIGELGSYVLDIGTGEWTSSDVLDRLFGIGKEFAHTVAGWTSLIHPEERDLINAYFSEEVVGKGRDFNKVYRIVRQTDHAERWVHGIGKLEFGGKGQPVKMRGVIKDITESKLSEMQLRDSEERYRATFEQAAVGIIHASFEGRILRCNARFAAIIDYPAEDIPGLTVQQITAPEDIAASSAVMQRVASGTGAEAREKRYIRKDGSLFWVKVTISMQRDCQGRPLHFIGFIEDISERKRAEMQLRDNEGRYRTVFQTHFDAISIARLEDGKILDCNQAFLDMTGYEREEVLGRTTLELRIWADARDRQAMTKMVQQDSSFRGLEIQFRKKNGDVRWGEMSASVMEIDGSPCILAITRDLSAAKAAEKTIQSLAFYDPLTGLPNRRMLMERLHHPLAASARSRRSQALLLIDLDHFKTLNDTLGHRTGDLMLQKSAQRIVACTHEADTVCRLGGDEFVVVLEDLSKVAEEAAAQAVAVGEKILAAIDQPCQIEEHECHSTASIGIAVFGDRQDNTDEILKQAEIALYQAKATGRNTFRFFSPALQATVNARAALEEDLRQGIKAQQFLLYYQPQMERGRVTGAEALIRWKHPRRGIVPPGEFIPLAEESRLILPLGDWVLETACEQIASWAGRKETAHLSVAVNISALQFRQQSFVEQVLATLSRTGANPGNLRLELTESMLVDNLDDIISKMNELKSHGLRFSLDDFGTGYSSLSYLKRLPLDRLKIDRSFVSDMLMDATSGAIAQTILSLGRAMGISVIAEGVETEEQRGYLAGLGCHSFQGFLFSRPLPLEQFEAFLRGVAEHSGQH
jgi:diguanylate cyclase (GGDEF)-like protein/PAS domain S-box-containing protein